MLEIHQSYVFDDDGTPIAVQIPIAQFKSLLGMVERREQVTLVDDEDLGWSADEAKQAIAEGLDAFEAGRYTECDEAGLQGLFDKIKHNARLKRGIQA
jgi:hypothetical protein